MQVYHFFGYLWITQFIIAVEQTTIAGAIASWYWVLDKKQIPSFPVLSSLKRVIRYHLGSMAFGSLIIAIIKFIRAVLAWLQRRLKGNFFLFKIFEYVFQYFNNNNINTLLGAQLAPLIFLLKCLSYCFAIYERFMKSINKNAYIMVHK